MPGLKNISTSGLNKAFLVVSAAMVLIGLVLVPGDGASTTTLLIWIMGALVLIGMWIAIGFELVRGLAARRPRR
jgi:Sec-independent protein secretion pathway component TatC